MSRESRAGQPRESLETAAWWTRAWPVALLAVLTAGFFFPLLASSSGEMMAGPDIAEYFLYLHDYTRSQFLAGRIPLWDSYNYCGMPFAANPQCSVFYPLSWLYLLMPVIHAQKYMIALHVLLGGGFMYLFLRRIVRSRPGAIAGCLPWMFGSYVMANAGMGHLTMLFTMAWLPAALYCAERWLTERRVEWIFWTGFVLGVQVIAGEPQNCYYTVLVVTLYLLISTIVDRTVAGRWWHPRRYGRWLGVMALIGVIAAMTAGIQLFPTAEYVPQCDRSGNTFRFVSSVSFMPRSFLVFLVPWSSNLVGAKVEIGGENCLIPLLWEYAGYVGIMTLILAAWSFFVRGQRPLWAARVLLVVAVLLMLGRFTPVYEWLYHGLPGLKMFRIPSRAIVITVWALCVMAAYGFDRLLQAETNRWRRRGWRWTTIAACAFLAGGVLAAFKYLHLTKALSENASLGTSYYMLDGISDPLICRPTCCLLATAVVLAILGRLPRRPAIVAVLLLVGADLFIAAPRVPLVKYSPEADINLLRLKRIMPPVGGGSEPYRVDLAPVAVAANAALAARVENVNGYWPMATGRFFRFAHWMRGIKTNPVIRHQLGNFLYKYPDSFPLRILNVLYASAAAPDGKMRLRRLAEPPPRAWVVDRAEVIPDDTPTILRLHDPQFAPARAVILTQPPRIDLKPADSPVGMCRVRKHENGDLDVETQTSRDGYLVLSEIFYPGWRATVDGKEVPVERADYLITALPLPAGTHRIEYRYDPLSFKAGAACTAVMCVAGVAVLVSARRRRGAPS